MTEFQQLSSNDVRKLISSYCFGTQSEREGIARAQPEIFQEDLLESLEEARSLMTSTGVAYDESEKLFSALMRQLDLPSEASAHRGGDEAADRDAPLPSQVAEMGKGQNICRREFDLLLEALLKDGPPPPAGSDEDLHARLEPQQLATSSSSSSWICRHAPLTLHILSFLPAEDLLSTCEDTCSVWRKWLCDEKTTAGPFWIGVVQREFPEQLMAVLSAPSASPESDPLDQDWRTIAMIGVCNADGTTNGLLDELAGVNNDAEALVEDGEDNVEALG